jgi:thiamine-monophosphate kinase
VAGGTTARPGEFDLIARYFAPLARGEAGALGLMDDAAVLAVPPGRGLVVTTDTLVAGIHFPADTAPEDVAAKLLRVNLSDLAAMGAEPRAYFLNAAWPTSLGEDWIARFARGLAEDQAHFAIALAGGDTVATPGPLTLTATALGWIEQGRELRRGGARAGDAVWVSGCIGDGLLGLMAARGELATDRDYLIGRLNRPTPRLALGRMLALEGLATAAADVSDGLVADLGHVCEASGLGAEIALDRLPLSDAARTALEHRPALRAALATGGDDYELVFTTAAEAAPAVRALAEDLDLPLTEIGRMAEGPARVRVLDASGADATPERGGFRHF